MKSFLTIIKSDYLQRTRSYAFLITLCASLAIAYTFVPEPNANYSTIRISDYVGFYNSAWFGYVTAIMTSIFLSLIGFYLVNSSIKTDIHTKVGQIVAATPVSNFKYLFSKVLSNFLVLLTIVGMVFLMSIVLFLLYNDGYAFEPLQFIKPYVIITLPSLFVISVLAAVFEVFFGKYSVVQNVGFFFVFMFLLAFSAKTENEFAVDLFGSKIVLHHLEETVSTITNTNETTFTNIGFVLGNFNKTNKFEFNGVDFPTSFIISRLLWVAFSIGLLFMVSFVFHRFNISERVSIKKVSSINTQPSAINHISLSSLPESQINYSIFPLLKAEFLLLFRKGKKWLWFLNIAGVILLAVLPIKTAHQLVLPILWFLQVSRLSNLITKEVSNDVHYFAFTSYKPINRLLFSQLLAGFLLMLGLAIPLLFKLSIVGNWVSLISVVFGAVFIVLLASLLGILTKGKKLFEVVFFMITYTNINLIPFADYFGGFEHNTYYLIWLSLFIILFGSIVLLKRTIELKQ